MVGAPECGDVMKLQIKVNPETGVIEDAKFKTFGCGSAIASSSLATEWVKGKTVDEALEIKNTEIVNELSLPPVKIHCSVLAEDAIKAAIDDYRKKQAALKTLGGSHDSASHPKRFEKIREAFAKQGVSEGGLRLGVLGGGCSGLSYLFRFEAKQRATRPGVRVRRRPGLRRPEEPALPGRHDARLQGIADAVRLRLRESERQEELRLRHLVLGLMAPTAGMRYLPSRSSALPRATPDSSTLDA